MKWASNSAPSSCWLRVRPPTKVRRWRSSPRSKESPNTAKDPEETNDLAADPAYRKERDDLDRALRKIVDPEAVNARAKADQAARIVAAGGRRAILEKGSFGYTPAPGEAVVYG